MRTNIEMDDQLVKQAMRSIGAPTKRAVVEAGLRLLVQTYAQTSIRKLRGKVKWEGNLDQFRLGRIQEGRSRNGVRP
jgi:Arc/MetJ family transcription regulator